MSSYIVAYTMRDGEDKYVVFNEDDAVGRAVDLYNRLMGDERVYCANVCEVIITRTLSNREGGDSLCDKVIGFRPDADHIISLLEDYDGDGCVTDDLLAYMRSHLQKGGDQ